MKSQLFLNLDDREPAPGHEAEPVARLDQVSLRYGRRLPALESIDLAIDDSSFQFLVGPSGAGKTSLLRLISLSLRPTKGKISLFGVDPQKTGEHERRRMRQCVGVIYQDFRLLEHVSAFDNVALPLRLSGAEDWRARTAVAEIMSWLGISSIIEKGPSELSVGERQLVAAARAIVIQPRLLLADEPTSSIDNDRAVRLMALFEHLNTKGTAVIVATHSRPLMAQANHPVIEIEKGRLRPVGLPRQVEQPNQQPPLALAS